MNRTLLIIALLMAGCKDESPQDTAPPEVDQDQDGYSADVDCDDGNAAIHPDATEICNGVDDDCDGDTDEDVMSTWYADADGDGYGDAGAIQEACEPGDGWVTDDSDCDDTDAAAYPGATEVCNGVDDDCDGDTDEDVMSTWYADDDGDGYGDATTTQEACEPSTGWVADSTDCDDGDAAAYPGATETCNGVDDDCDGDTDEGVTPTWYADADGDGYGDVASSTAACSAPSGTVADASDCDDTNAQRYPGATELCDGMQNDCSDSGWIDDAGLASLYDSTGAWSDLSATLGAGSSSGGVTYEIADGDSVYLCEGTWYAGLELAASGALVGIGTDVVLDGSGTTGRLVDATGGGDVLVENLTLQFGAEASDSGGGLRAAGLDSLVLNTVTVTGCTATLGGGGAFSYIDEMAWTDVTFDGNVSTSNNGGGVFMTSVTDFVADGVAITDNEANGSGGGLVTSGSTTSAHLVDLVVSGNSATDYGGGWYIESGTYSAESCEIDGNVAGGSGGGIDTGATLSLTDCSVTSNQGSWGGGLILESGSLTFTGDTVVFDQNTGSGAGAAIHIGSGDTASCTDCDFTDNTDTRGALNVESGASLSISNGDFSGNSPYDVRSGSGYTWGTAVSFTCDGTSCY